MRKLFSKLAIILTTSSLVLPLTACTYNFYVNSAIDAVTKSLANQTSTVIKSLVMSKEKDADTSQTIQDMFSQFPNPSMRNQTSGVNLNTWEEFEEKWGFDQKIATRGFNTNDYFKQSGDGSLTQQVNSYRTINDVLDKANLISGLNVANNQILYDLIKSGDIKNSIVNFLTETKKSKADLPDDLKTIITLLKNITIGKDWTNPDATAFTQYIITPLTSLLNNLTKGWWAPNQTTPTDASSFKTFLDNWKDTEGHPYSQWNEGSNWDIKASYDTWNTNDYNFYRSGTLVNYLFYKIGKDYQIKNPAKPDDPYKDRYLGDIISDHLNGASMDDYLMDDLGLYFPHLLENPAYIITLIEAIVLILKQWGLKMSDITQGTKKLTFAKKYPTDDPNNSYNARDILTNFQKILSNPDNDPENPSLKYIIESLIGLHKMGTPVVGSYFAYDIKITVDLGIIKLVQPLGLLTTNPLVKPEIEKLVNSLMETINGLGLSSIFDNIINLYDQWVKQYNDKDDGIIFDLEKLQDFLLNDTNGLITIINRDIIPVLYNIMTRTEDPVTDEDYLKFYESLGGQRPRIDNTVPLNFRDGSALAVLKTSISDSTTSLGQLILILLGNSSEDNSGIFSFVIQSNNQWINDNYTRFFDINNNSNNRSNGRIYNLQKTNNNSRDYLSDILTYNFKYSIETIVDNQIKIRTYSFLIETKSWDLRTDFTGTKNFYFTNITLQSVK